MIGEEEYSQKTLTDNLRRPMIETIKQLYCTKFLPGLERNSGESLKI
jgi:hypothetical protein